MNPDRRRGFSLIELMVTLGVTSLLAMVVMQAVGDYRRLMFDQEKLGHTRAELSASLKMIRFDLQQVGSDPSPRRWDSYQSPGFALGRLTDTLSLPRGVLPLGVDSVQLFSYRPYDQDGDGLLGGSEGLCTTVTRIDDETFTSSDSNCYPDSVTPGTQTTYVPLKPRTRDNILYAFSDCDEDGTKDCLTAQDLGDHRSSGDDREAEILATDIQAFLVYYVLEDGRTVFFDGTTGYFSDGTDDDIEANQRDLIQAVLIQLRTIEAGRVVTYSLTQQLAVTL